MKKKMTNKKILECLNGLYGIQEEEKRYFEKTGKKLLQGKVKITYAIGRNLEELQKQLKTYNDVFGELAKEYREIEKEQELVEKERKLAEKENRVTKDIPIIVKKGKTKEEYFEKIEELQEIETDADIYTVSIELMDGIELDSNDINKIFFMLEE